MIGSRRVKKEYITQIPPDMTPDKLPFPEAERPPLVSVRPRAEESEDLGNHYVTLPSAPDLAREAREELEIIRLEKNVTAIKLLWTEICDIGKEERPKILFDSFNNPDDLEPAEAEEDEDPFRKDLFYKNYTNMRELDELIAVAQCLSRSFPPPSYHPFNHNPAAAAAAAAAAASATGMGPPPYYQPPMFASSSLPFATGRLDTIIPML